MNQIPLKRLATLRLDQRRREQGAVITLDQIGAGTGALLTDPWESPSEKPPAGVADCEPGDVLFGKLRPYLAKVLQLKQRTYASTELLCLRPQAGVDSRWFYYRMLARPTVEWAVATSEGTKMPRTSWSRVGDYRVHVPPLDKQRSIAAYLDAETAVVDRLIAIKTALVGHLLERLQREISEAVDGRQVITVNQQHLGTAGTPVKRCFRSTTYGTGQASRDSGRIAVFGMGNLKDDGNVVGPPAGYVDDIESELLLRPGDLLFNRTNSREKVGKVGIVGLLPEPTTFASYLVRFNLSGLASADYLNYLLNSEEVLQIARSSALPSIGQANLNPNRYGVIRIILPSAEQQSAIVNCLNQRRDRTRRLVGHVEQQVTLLQERRQALITAAVTGKLNISVAA